MADLKVCTDEAYTNMPICWWMQANADLQVRNLEQLRAQCENIPSGDKTEIENCLTEGMNSKFINSQKSVDLDVLELLPKLMPAPCRVAGRIFSEDACDDARRVITAQVLKERLTTKPLLASANAAMNSSEVGQKFNQVKAQCDDAYKSDLEESEKFLSGVEKLGAGNTTSQLVKAKADNKRLKKEISDYCQAPTSDIAAVKAMIEAQFKALTESTATPSTTDAVPAVTDSPVPSASK